MLCDDLEGWVEECGGREVQEGGEVCIHTADSPCFVQQKLTQHCKVIILQFKKKRE